MQIALLKTIYLQSMQRSIRSLIVSSRKTCVSSCKLHSLL